MGMVHPKEPRDISVRYLAIVRNRFQYIIDHFGKSAHLRILIQSVWSAPFKQVGLMASGPCHIFYMSLLIRVL